jgi:GTP-binding protein
MAVSAVRGTNVDGLLRAAATAAESAAADTGEEIIPIHRPREADSVNVARDPDGAWRVAGRGVERAASMTYWEHDEAVRRFQRTLARMGVEQALRQAGVRPGDTVRIGEFELQWQE